MIKPSILMVLFASFTIFVLHAGHPPNPNNTIIKLTDDQSFTPEAIRLDFEGQQESAIVSDLFSAWGVTFLESSVAVPKIRIRLIASTSLAPPRATPVLRNESTGDPSANANHPLVINFRFPLKRVAFSLDNGNQAVTARISAFDMFGNLLGLVEQASIAGGNFAGVFVGLETTAVQGISKVVIDYGDSENSEEVDWMLLDFVSRPTFTTFLAQVGDGEFPDGAQAFKRLSPPPIPLKSKSKVF
ncbi:MAG: hypothetical protein ACRD1R_08970 [Acidobacteriota bacterium]